MSDTLYARLQRMKKARETGEDVGHAPQHASEIHNRTSGLSQPLSGTSEEAARSLRRQGFEHDGDTIWRRRVYRRVGSVAARLVKVLRHGGFLVPKCATELRFFDAETTGLSAGAGTVAFLVGAGRLYDEQTLEIDQLLLPDYPAEVEFLERVAALLPPESLLVSYNGKGFDTHVLRSRFLMNGIPWAEPKQIDLLYAARRLWGTVLPDCRLATVEHRVLGVERTLDLPGYEVPERYFTYLETGVAETLREVMAHHEQDIVTLVLLLDTVEQLLEDAASSEEEQRYAGEDSDAPERESRLSVPDRLSPDVGIVDPVGVARTLLHIDAERAVSYLRSVCDLERPVGVQRRALVLLAGLLKRRKSYEEAAEIWSVLFRTGRSGVAGLELAKHLEHREKNAGAALAVCNELARLGYNDTDALEHRRARLRRKLARQT